MAQAEQDVLQELGRNLLRLREPLRLHRPLALCGSKLGDRAETVLRAYAHLLPADDAQAAATVAALIA